MSLGDAAEWNHQGELALGDGRIDEAVDAFRRATVRDRSNTRYVLALARALALKHDEEGARAALLSLRESSPEDADINLELARLAAARQDVTESLRFYHNALYAPWPVEAADARRAVRFELVEFLLTHNQAKRAVSELLALSTDLPDDVPHHLRAARLFSKAGDASGALTQYEAALALDRDNTEALVGAGRAAYVLGNYALARTRLRKAPPADDDVRRTLEVVDLILSRDPLASRIGATERRTRLLADFEYATQRNAACVAANGPQSTRDDEALEDDIRTYRETLQASPLEQDTIESGVDLMARIARRVETACGPATAMDQALLLIARQHGSDSP